MIFLFNAVKYSLKSILLCWYPFGRASAKEYRYCVWTISFVMLSAVLFIWILDYRFPDSKIFRLITGAIDRTSPSYGVAALLVLFFTMLSAVIRRGHDLGYSAFYTVTHACRGDSGHGLCAGGDFPRGFPLCQRIRPRTGRKPPFIKGFPSAGLICYN